MYRYAILSVNVTVIVVLVLLTVHSLEAEAVTIATLPVQVSTRRPKAADYNNN